MQWKKAGVMALILFSLFLASCTPASGPSADDIWDKVVKIGSLGFLGDSPENDLIALTRVLIFILIFALLFEGSKLTGLSRNSAIVVSAVLAIMSTIFIPASILLGIGAAYSTVIAILIVGAPVVGGLLVHRIFSGDSGGHKVARLFILVILSLYLFAVMNAAADYNGPLGLLANGILEFVWWGLLLIFFMLVWELFHSFQILGVGSALSSGSKGAWKAIKARFPGTALYARRTHKRELNEYILEKTEEVELDSVKGEALRILSDLRLFANRKQFLLSEQLNLVKSIEGFGELINKTGRIFNSLSKRTSRADNSLDQMFNYFKEKGIKVPEEVKILEKSIMMLHQKTAQDIAGVEGIYGKIVHSEAMEKLKSMTPEMFAAPKMFGGAPYKIETKAEPFNLEHLYQLIEGFEKEEFLLEDAYKKQAEAEKNMLGIIQETRSLYE